jgi:hypothetical protein
VPWEPDHIYRGNRRVHYTEVHYDNDEEDEYEDEALDASLEQSQDSCAFVGQLDGHDDSACSLASLSNNIEDSTRQHSGDTCEDSYVLAPGMRSCIGENVLPMEMSMTQSLPSRTFMLDMTHEDISDILEVVEEPHVVLEHKGHMDLQTQEERHGLETVD